MYRDFDSPIPASPQRSPNGFTGIVAAITALASGAVCSVGAFVAAVIAADAAGDEPGANDVLDLGPLVATIFAGIALLAAMVAALYLLGGVLLLLRRTAGRVLVIIVALCAAIAATVQLTRDPNVFAATVSVLCATNVVLAALPSTGRWIAARPVPGLSLPPGR